MSSTRQTRVVRVDPDRPDPSLIAEAARVLRDGGLVAFPTETVYGLGADATNPEAVARIFEAKGRPSRNPLIVHVSDLDMARACIFERETVGLSSGGSDWVWRGWWPGPITFVHDRSALIPDVVTGGSRTVGVRMPRSEIALALIAELGRPVAAPSANRSENLSPTTAEHVLKDLDGRIDLILDGGPTEVGLESTVVDMTRWYPRVLRPGPITASELIRQSGLGIWPGRPDPMEEAQGITSIAKSPGQSRKHYAPKTPAYWVEPELLGRFFLAGRGAQLVIGRPGLPASGAEVLRIELETPAEAARRLYATLHDLDAQGFDYLLVVPPPDTPDWEAVRDRLWRATRPAPQSNIRR